MIVTEEQAKKKWCPMSRSIWGSGDGSSVSGNRNEDGSLSKADKCCGMLCMMWRSLPPRHNVYWKDGEQIIERIGNGVEEGYCGLAGNPHA